MATLTSMVSTHRNTKNTTMQSRGNERRQVACQNGSIGMYAIQCFRRSIDQSCTYILPI